MAWLQGYPESTIGAASHQQVTLRGSPERTLIRAGPHPGGRASCLLLSRCLMRTHERQSVVTTYPALKALIDVTRLATTSVRSPATVADPPTYASSGRAQLNCPVLSEPPLNENEHTKVERCDEASHELRH
jgi:hypothetical protein